MVCENDGSRPRESITTYKFARYLIASLVFAIVITVESPLAAEEQPLVVLVSLGQCCVDRAWPAAERRIQKELLLSNLRVLVADGIPTPDGRYSEALEALAKENGAAAAVTVFRSKDSIDTTLAVYTRSDSAPSNLQEIEISSKPNEDTAEIVAIRAVEAIRAAVLEERTAPESEPEARRLWPGEPERPAARVDGPGTGEKPGLSKVRLYARFLAEGALGGVGAMGAVGAGVRWRPYRHLFAGIGGTISVVGRDIENEEGTARAEFDIVTARLSAAWELPVDGMLRPCFGLSAGVGYVWTSGSSSQALDEPGAKRAVMFYGGGFGELSLAVSRRVWIPIGIQVGVMPPGVTIRFGGQEVATLDMVFMEASLGLVVHLI